MMNMTRLIIVFALMFIPLMTQLEAWTGEEEESNYVREACSVTQYQEICVNSLASFSKTAKRNPSIWARAGVSVTLSEAKNVAQFLKNLKKNGSMKETRNRVALLDCIECFQDALDNLHKSLEVLRGLNSNTFDAQMEDVMTWMSAVMTDEDTCSDGFSGGGGTEKMVEMVRNRAVNVTYVTSNALALINKLASTGLQSRA